MPIISGGSGGSTGVAHGAEIGYDQITSLVSIASTTESAGTPLISCAAHTFDGSPVLVQVFGLLETGTLSANNFLCLFEGATQIARLFVWSEAAAATQILHVNGFFRFTPTTGSHTYTLTGFTNNSGGTQAQFGGGAAGTGAVGPAFVRFTKV